MADTALTRRNVLASSTLLVSLAGCSGSEDSDGGDDPGAGPTNPENLDLREANVIDVEFESENGSVSFDVTLHHDDEGEEGYANWWQVETLDGDRLGRRELAHPHSQQPFTRSATFEIPTDVSCVVVRGHDQTHGYGGQAMLVNLDSGAVRRVTQGADSDSFDSDDCP